MTAWFLRLFQFVRLLEQQHRQTDQICHTLQAENAALKSEVAWLRDQVTTANAAKDDALKSLANIGLQMQFGVKPPYPESFSLPERKRSAPGPMPTNRVFGHDAVHEGTDDFFRQIDAYYAERKAE